MTWVKICGMTNLADTLVAVEAGADAVGFVFDENSPRCVTVETAREIVAKLPEHVETVGVFAGESVVRAEEVGDSVGFDALQVYTRSGPRILEILENVAAGYPSQRQVGRKKIYLALPISKVVAEQVEEQGLTIEMHDPAGQFVSLLLDSGSGAQPGGTGVTFDWNQAAATVAGLRLRHKIVIAGGLNPQNVGQAMGILKPWGVDVVSGVEARPGKKAPEKVRAFVRAVQEMDRRGS